MPIYSIYLISKSGSLLYQRDFKIVGSPIAPQDANDYLIIASNLHGIHTIAAKLTPPAALEERRNATELADWSSTASSASTANTTTENDFEQINTNSNKTGLRSIYTDVFNMHIHQTVTGVKIILITSPDVRENHVAQFQNQLYKLYSHYVMKNPFYTLDMPIRISLFDDKIANCTLAYNIK